VYPKPSNSFIASVASMFFVFTASALVFGQTRTARTFMLPPDVGPLQHAMPLVLPLFVENVDFSSTLVLVNGANRSTYADVTVRATDGTVAQKRVDFGSHSQRQVAIADLLRSAGSSITTGSIVIRQSPDLRGATIAAQLALTFLGSPDGSFIDEEVAMPMPGGSEMLRGVADEAHESPVLAITSLSSDQAQDVTVTCFPEHGKPFSKSLSLPPNQTLFTAACEAGPSGDFQDILSQLPMRKLGAAGIAVTSTAGSDSLAAFALTPHDHSGQAFFTGVAFNDPMMAKSSTDVYAGVPVGPSSLLPDGRYSPQISLANFSVKPANVSVRFAETMPGGEVSTTNQKQVLLSAGQSQSISFNELASSAGLQNSFEITSDASPGDVLTKLVSRGDGSLRVVEMAAKDLKDEHDGGMHPWSVERGTNSNLLLFNSSAAPQTFNVLIGSEGILWQKAFKLASMETRNISINDLITHRIKDDGGKTVPPDVQNGQIGWFVARPGVGKGRLLQANREVAMARSFSCPLLIVLCGDTIGVDDAILLSVIAADGGSIDPVWCESFSGSCPGEPNGQAGTATSYSWSTGNTSVVSISGSSTNPKANLLGAGVGRTTVTGKIEDGNGCTVTGSGPSCTVDFSLDGDNNSIFVGSDANLLEGNLFFFNVNPTGGTFSASSSNSSDSITFSSASGQERFQVQTSTQSASVGDRTLTFNYTAPNCTQPVTVTQSVTARQFAYLTNYSPSNTCTLGFGTKQTYVYTVFTHPDKTAIDSTNSLQGTPVAESFDHTPKCAQTGNGNIDPNGQFSDNIVDCGNTPLTCSDTVTQTLSIAGVGVRKNTLQAGSNGITYTNDGPTQ